jgi:uncharacterized protein
MSEFQSWKPSLFNLTLECGGKSLLFNSKTAQIIDINASGQAVIKECFDYLLKHGTYPNADLLACLVTLGFVVPAGVDEFQREKDHLRKTMADVDRLFLTIAPTMACNQHCSYCFQRNTPKTKIMSLEMQQAVIDFVRCKVGNSKQLAVQWFGGEPLIAYDTIASMTRAFKSICRDRDINYYAEMLTNGMLLTQERVATLPSLEIKALQISLDGTPETYAERREVALPTAEVYYQFIVENMQDIVDATGSVTIRINVDKKNVEEAKYVVGLFKAHGVVDQRIDFRLGFINTSRGLIDCMPHDCFTNTEFSEEELGFRHFLEDQGYMVFGMPLPKNYPCTAILRNAYTIDPIGNVGKCIPAVGTNQSVFARILPANMEKTLADTAAIEVPYGRFDPFRSKGCGSCKLIPVCLGSCPKHHVNDERIVDCSMREGLSEKMAFYHRFHKCKT